MTESTEGPMPDTEPEDPPAASVRWPELAVAVLLMALAMLVIKDSLRVGIGWADDGPRSGYFPFYIGWALLLSSAFVAASTLLRWKRLTAAFVGREALSSVFAVFWPTVAYVGLIALAGIYAASVLLIGYFMRRHGKYGWLATAGVSVGVMLVFYVVFERWFLVPLPKGPIEAWLAH